MGDPTSSSSPVRIVVDAMGGDFAPNNDVLGAVEAQNSFSGIEVILVGDKSKILETLKNNSVSFPEKNIVHASDVIGMKDNPTRAVISKPDSSLVRGLNLVKEGKADAFVSAGNTGAVAAASNLVLGRIEGIERSTMGTYFPTEKNITTIFDVGSNVDSKPSHLFGFAMLGSIYVETLFNIKNPTVALLSVGEEEGKGGKTIKETYELLKNSQLNFIGNVEGRDLFAGCANVVVCDGFVGNILIKFGESFPKFMRALFRQHAEKSLINKLKIGMLKPTMKEAFKPLDYQEYGGLPLLGLKGITIIGHGSSSVLAIKNMVLRAKEMVERKLISKIEQSLKLNSNILVTTNE